jgi:hypothetical protein
VTASVPRMMSRPRVVKFKWAPMADSHTGSEAYVDGVDSSSRRCRAKKTLLTKRLRKSMPVVVQPHEYNLYKSIRRPNRAYVKAYAGFFLPY